MSGPLVVRSPNDRLIVIVGDNETCPRCGGRGWTWWGASTTRTVLCGFCRETGVVRPT